MSIPTFVTFGIVNVCICLMKCSDNCQWKSRNVDCYEYVDDKATRQVDDSYCTGPKPPTKKSCGPADCSINGMNYGFNSLVFVMCLVIF